jgi:hypothetical protein
MADDLITANNCQVYQGTYLDVERLEDGRYRVQFVKSGATPRTSYTAFTDAVVKQAQRAGNIPVHTSDQDLQRLCRDHLVELIEWQS